MDTIKNAIGLGDNQNNEESSSKKEEGNFFTRIGDKINAMAGGGPESEKKEDLLDKSELPCLYYLLIPLLRHVELAAGIILRQATPRHAPIDNVLTLDWLS